MTKQELKYISDFKKFVENVCKVKPVFKQREGLLHFITYTKEVLLLFNYIEQTSKIQYEYLTEKMDEEGNKEIIKELKNVLNTVTSDWYVKYLK